MKTTYAPGVSRPETLPIPQVLQRSKALCRYVFHLSRLGLPVLIALLAPPLYAQTLTVLASFNGSNGYEPNSGLTLSDNTLYGTAMGGGVNNVGVVFGVPLSGGSPTVLASFNQMNGAWPEAGLTLSGNTL